MDPNGPTSTIDELVASTVPALQGARVLQLIKDHGLMTGILVCLAWQIGVMAKAQDYMCGV